MPAGWCLQDQSVNIQPAVAASSEHGEVGVPTEAGVHSIMVTLGSSNTACHQQAAQTTLTVDQANRRHWQCCWVPMCVNQCVCGCWQVSWAGQLVGVLYCCTAVLLYCLIAHVAGPAGVYQDIMSRAAIMSVPSTSRLHWTGPTSAPPGRSREYTLMYWHPLSTMMLSSLRWQAVA